MFDEHISKASERSTWSKLCWKNLFCLLIDHLLILASKMSFSVIVKCPPSDSGSQVFLSVFL